jgi:hypothetical protein
MNQEYFKTKNGTELPILNLKGKPYLQVAHRVIWFREQHPEGRIETIFLFPFSEASMISVCKAKIYDGEGKLLAEATKREDMKHFPDFIEKSETGAIGRALALCGYGTQFAESDFDEMPRVVDSPIMPAKAPKPDYAAAKITIQQKEPTVFAPNPMLRLQEAAKAYAWSGEQMRIFMQSRFGKLLVKELTEKEIALLCETMNSQSHAAAMESLKDNIK